MDMFKAIGIGTVVGLGIVLLMIGSWWLIETTSEMKYRHWYEELVIETIHSEVTEDSLRKMEE